MQLMNEDLRRAVHYRKTDMTQRADRSQLCAAVPLLSLFAKGAVSRPLVLCACSTAMSTHSLLLTRLPCGFADVPISHVARSAGLWYSLLMA
jgi:hypothetical protein